MSRRVALMPAPLAGPFGRMQSAPLPSQKDLDGYDGTFGSQVRAQEGEGEEGQEGPEEEEEGQDGQKEAALQEGSASVPGQIARHGQAREERQFGHDLASIGASLSPGRSHLKSLAQTL